MALITNRSRHRPHWLRHAHATHALLRGAPAHVVQGTLGPASLATTIRYVHMATGESSGLVLAGADVPVIATRWIRRCC